MSASFVPDLNAGEIDLGEAFELSGFSRVREFQGKLYAFDGETGGIKRYTLDDELEMVPDTLSDGETPAEFSMAGEGVTSFSTPMAWIDSETAYYFDIFFGQSQVIKWNPTEMTIEDTISVPEVQKEGLDPSAKDTIVIEDRIVLPISWANIRAGELYPNVAMAIFSAETGELVQIVEDDRCTSTRDPFVQDGKVYVVGDNVRGLAELAAPDTDLPPPCLLRWTPGESEFDADFYLDLEATVGTGLVSGAMGRGDDTMVMLAYTSEDDPSQYGLRQLLDENLWQWAVVDFQAEESTIVDSVPPQGVSALGWLVDGAYLVPRFNTDAGTSTLYEIDAEGATELLTVTGEIFHVAKVR
jgi:hypothetical protein